MLDHQRMQRFDRGSRRVAQVDAFGAQRDAAAGNPRDIEQIVEQAGHVPGLPLDDLPGFLACAVLPTRGVEQPCGAQNRGQRVAQLVRQHRQELLAPADAFLNLFFDLLALRDVEERDHRADQLVVADDRVAPILRGERGAVGAPQHLVVDVGLLAVAHRVEDRATARADTACRRAACGESADASACRSAPTATRSRAAARRPRCRRCRRRSGRCRRSPQPSSRGAGGCALPGPRAPCARATSAVMSREIAEMPTSACDPFRIGENVTETSTRLSSFLTWVVLEPLDRAGLAHLFQRRLDLLLLPGRPEEARMTADRLVGRVAVEACRAVVPARRRCRPVVWLTMASSDDSTMAESCASLARACSSAEMSVSVITTPPALSLRPSPGRAGSAGSSSVRSCPRSAPRTARRSSGRGRCRASGVGCVRSCEKACSGRPMSCGMTLKISAMRGVNLRMQRSRRGTACRRRCR